MTSAYPDWQPIETAPRDGTEVIVADAFGVAAAFYVSHPTFEQWREDCCEDDVPDDEAREDYEEQMREEGPEGWMRLNTDEAEFLSPSLWMPMPPLPAPSVP